MGEEGRGSASVFRKRNVLIQNLLYSNFVIFLVLTISGYISDIGRIVHEYIQIIRADLAQMKVCFRKACTFFVNRRPSQLGQVTTAWGTIAKGSRRITCVVADSCPSSFSSFSKLPNLKSSDKRVLSDQRRDWKAQS